MCLFHSVYDAISSLQCVSVYGHAVNGFTNKYIFTQEPTYCNGVYVAEEARAAKDITHNIKCY